MEHSRKQKLLMIIALIAGIASLSVGFAAFSVTLNITSSASVAPSSDTFSVKFSTSQNSLVVGAVAPSSNPNSLVTTNGTIDNAANPTIKGLSTTFTSPGQYVEYIFYVRNEGEYVAYLNNINFLGGKTCSGETGTTASLVQSACEDINITATVGDATYTETTPITGHSLAKSTGEQIKIKLEYSSTGTSVDGAFSITFPNIAFVYSSIDDSSMQPTLSEKVVKLESGTLSDPGSIVSIGNEKFYVIGQEDGNVKLFSMYNLYVGGKYTSIWIAYGDEATGLQDSTMLGYLQSDYTINGTTVFSSSSQKGNNYSDYNGSIVEGYVNNYVSYLEELGVRVTEARLIYKEELEYLGCSYSDRRCRDGAPDWVYATSFWTGTPSSSEFVYTVQRSSVFGNAHYTTNQTLGVRPVIEISLSEF